jgi:hypothetical protein
MWAQSYIYLPNHKHDFILPLVMNRSGFYVFYFEGRKEIMCKRTKKLDLTFKEIGFDFLRISGSVFSKGRESYLSSKFVRRKGMETKRVKNYPNLLITPECGHRNQKQNLYKS